MTLSFLESYVRVFWNSWILYLSNLSNSIWIFVKVVATPCPCKMHCRRGWSLTWKYVYLPESTNVWLMRHCRAVVGKQQTRTLQLGDEALPSAVLEALSLDVLQFKFASFRFHLEVRPLGRCRSHAVPTPGLGHFARVHDCMRFVLLFSSVFYTWPPCGGLIRAQDAKTAHLGFSPYSIFIDPQAFDVPETGEHWFETPQSLTQIIPNYSKIRVLSSCCRASGFWVDLVFHSVELEPQRKWTSCHTQFVGILDGPWLAHWWHFSSCLVSWDALRPKGSEFFWGTMGAADGLPFRIFRAGGALLGLVRLKKRWLDSDRHTALLHHIYTMFRVFCVALCLVLLIVLRLS